MGFYMSLSDAKKRLLLKILMRGMAVFAAGSLLAIFTGYIDGDVTSLIIADALMLSVWATDELRWRKKSQ